MRAAIAIRNAAQNTSASESVIDDLVSSEPVVAAAMLRFANSAAYRRRGAVTSIRDATKLLGYTVIREIAAHVAMMQLVNGLRSSVLRALAEDLFRHSLTVSCVAEFLARDLEHADPPRVGAIALFHELPLFHWMLQADRAPGKVLTAEAAREAAQRARLTGIEPIMRDLELDEFAIPSVADHSIVELAHGTSWDPNPLVPHAPIDSAAVLDESRLGGLRKRINALHGLIDVSQSADANYGERDEAEPDSRRPARPARVAPRRRTHAYAWIIVVMVVGAIAAAALLTR